VEFELELVARQQVWQAPATDPAGGRSVSNVTPVSLTQLSVWVTDAEALLDECWSLFGAVLATGRVAVQCTVQAPCVCLTLLVAYMPVG